MAVPRKQNAIPDQFPRLNAVRRIMGEPPVFKDSDGKIKAVPQDASLAADESEGRP